MSAPSPQAGRQFRFLPRDPQDRDILVLSLGAFCLSHVTTVLLQTYQDEDLRAICVTLLVAAFVVTGWAAAKFWWVHRGRLLTRVVAEKLGIFLLAWIPTALCAGSVLLDLSR